MKSFITKNYDINILIVFLTKVTESGLFSEPTREAIWVRWIAFEEIKREDPRVAKL